MAATRPLFTNRSPKPEIAVGSPLRSRIIKTYTPSSVVNYALTPGAIRFTFSPIHIPRTLFNGLATQNKVVTSRVLCSSDSAGFTNPLEGYKQFHAELRQWCDKQCLPVGGAVYTFFQAFESFVFGLVWRYFGGRLLGGELKGHEQELLKDYTGIYYPLVLSIVGNPLYVARSYAILSAGYYGTPYVLKRLRGEKEDILSSMMKGFVTIGMFLVVSGMRSPKIITIGGVISALMLGFVYKLRGRGSEQPQVEDENEKVG